MADQKVNIKVTAQGAKKAQDDLKGVEGAISKMGKAVGIATGAYFGARGLISGLSTVVQLSAEQELAEKKLSTALGRTSKSLLEQASALQKVTTFGDEAIISQQAFLASLNFSEERIKEIIPLALDLSSATGMALDSAVRNVSKTFSGLQGELGELIPQLKELTQEELKAGGALEVISELMGGSAQENTETLAGKLEQTRNAVLDAGESLGELLAPTVIATADAVAFLSDKLVSGAKFIGNLIAGGDTATETTNEFAGAQKKLAEETERANVALKDQLTEEQLLNQFTEKTVAGFQAEIAQLQERKMVLLGNTEQEIELRKAGFSRVDVPPLIKEEIDLLISLRNQVKFLQDAEDNRELLKEQKKLEEEKAKLKEENIQKDLRGAILSGQSAKQAMTSVVRAETMEAVAGLLSSILKSVPYPFNLIAGAGAGAVASSLMDNALASVTAETGFEGVVTKPTMFLTGENNKPEQVSVVPLGGQSASGITVNISAPLVDETVVDSIIPAIEKAKRMNLA
jgi:hypothetical protein